MLIIGETLADLGDSFGPPAGDGVHAALVVGIHRLAPEEHAFSEVVFDDARITPQLLETPSIPVAYLVRGVTPLGPAAVGAAEIESLLQRLGATRPRRGTGAMDLGDLTT